MCDYRQMYLHLFNAVTDAVEQMQCSILDEKQYNIVSKLITAQQECEDMFIEQE